MAADLLFARFAPKNLEPKNSIGAKWMRMLDRMELGAVVEGKRTAIKMHLGGGVGFSTIHPFFARKLVERVKAAGAKEVFVTDTPSAARQAVERGYTAEVVGCPIISASGANDRYFYPRRITPPFLSLDSIDVSGEIVDAEALIDFSHVKGHGACGFGGASKNLSMGCVTQQTRGRLHALEGGLEWDKRKCSGCKVCRDNCPNGAIQFNAGGEFSVFYHDCKYCQHCVLICPEKAITMLGGRYKDFQKGMALATAEILKTFERKNVCYINVLLNITILCDCWGMTTPTLVPDIGIISGGDIVSVERASLDMVKVGDLIPGQLPPGFKLGEEGHLFERIHRKDPYVVTQYLEELGWGESEYNLVEVE